MVKTLFGAAVIFGGLGLSAQAQSLNTQPYAACSPFTGFPLVLNLGTAPLGVPGESVRCTNTKISAAINALPALIGAGSGSVGSLAATVASFGTTLSGLNTTVTNLNTTVTGLNSKLGTANGIATLDGATTVPLFQIPSSIRGLPAQVTANTAGLATLNGKLGAANGIATLGSDGKLLPAQGGAAAAGVLLTGVGALNTAYASTANPNVIVFGSGNSVSFCPALSCNAGPTIDHQRTSAMFSAVTQDDGHSEEQTVAITTTVGTGTYKIWARSTAYAVGDNVNFQDSRNAVYRVTQAGTSAASGSGPTGTGTSIADGTVVWSWINAAAINAKVGLYNEIQIVPGGGNSWAQANNFQLQPGVKPLFHTNLELDFTNNSGTDCAYGVANCYGLYIISNGTNKSTAAIALQGLGQSANIGMRAAGSYSDATYSIDTTGVYGIAFQHLTPATYAVAALQDKSTAPVSLNLLGTNSFAAIHMAGAGNVGIDMRDNTYVGAQVLGKGWTVALDGSATVQNLGVNGQSYEFAPFVPPTSNTSCTKGQHSWDANYEYRCVATNTWKRAALSAW